MLSNRIGRGSSMSAPSTPEALWQLSDVPAGVGVDSFVDELDQFMPVAANAQCAVAGVDQFDRGVHDRGEGGVEFQTGCHGQHRVDKSVQAISALDDLLDTILYLVQQFAQPQLRQRLAKGAMVSLIWSGHDRSLLPPLGGPAIQL